MTLKCTSLINVDHFAVSSKTKYTLLLKDTHEGLLSMRVNIDWFKPG